MKTSEFQLIRLLGERSDGLIKCISLLCDVSDSPYLRDATLVDGHMRKKEIESVEGEGCLLNMVGGFR